MPSLADIEAPIHGELKAFNAYLDRLIALPFWPLSTILKYTLLQRGKQLRPVLVYLTAGACGGVTPATTTAAAMVELVHNASLLHDDVVDQAELRRGMPAVYRLWKSRGAVLTGDYMLALGLQLAVDSGQYELLGFMNSAVQQMSQSELDQIQRAKRGDTDEGGYYRVIRGKTAALLRTCAAAGAKTGGADAAIVQKLADFGENLGMAFQIRDDILDFSSHTVTGKTGGNDLREGKMTLPVIYALEGVPSGQRRFYLRLLARARVDERARQEAFGWIVEGDALEKASQRIAFYTQRAEENLEVLADTVYKQSLLGLAEYLKERKK